ncbi:MAG: PepSY domain-containing protein [Cellulosilyticum sp.]|nr:PepSY domain-containing protein [Cellulosilyticum sp.]
MKDMREYTGQNKGMVKRIITWGVTLGILIGVGAVGLEFYENKQDERVQAERNRIIYSQAEQNGTTLISEDAAKQIAFESAGVQAELVKYLKVQLDTDREIIKGSGYVYEIEFVYNGLEYDYEVDAIEGIVLDANVDSWHD